MPQVSFSLGFELRMMKPTGTGYGPMSHEYERKDTSICWVNFQILKTCNYNLIKKKIKQTFEV